MLGTSKTTRGGISSVIRAYEDAGLFDNYAIEYIATHKDGNFITKLAYSIGALLKFLSLLVKRDVFLVHIHSASNYSFWRKSLFFFISKALSKKIIYHIHGGGFVAFYNNASKFGQRLIKYILMNSQVIIVLTDSWRNMVIETVGAARIETLQNPITDSEYCSIANHPVDNRLLFLGLVKKEKGVFDILSAMYLLRENYNLTVNLDVCGVGDIAKLKQKAKKMGMTKNIVVHGWVDAKKIKELMSKATAFILPSYYEGLPMSIIEAMAASVPVIASNVGGIPDIIKDGENGMLIEPGNIKAMAEKIKRIVENKDERIEISQKAKEMVLISYSQKIVIDKLIEIYNRVLEDDMRLLFARDR